MRRTRAVIVHRFGVGHYTGVLSLTEGTLQYYIRVRVKKQFKDRVRISVGIRGGGMVSLR